MEFTLRGIFADGRWTESRGELRDVINPATEETVLRAADGTEADVDLAVRSARLALEHGPWAGMKLPERAAILTEAMRLVAERGEEFAQMQTAQMGVPVSASRGMVGVAGAIVRAYVEGGASLQYEYLRRDGAGQALIRREPVGVVGVIAPWNGPLLNTVNKSAPALLAGCTVVVKPAGQTPAEAGLFAELCAQAGMPDGVFNVVPGGRPTGRYLVANPGVDMITFTGSTISGREVGRVCADAFKRVSLELGGKSAAIVLGDVDIAAAAPLLSAGNFSNSGQACIALTRVLVPRQRHDEIVEALCEQAAARVIGDPADPATDTGPLVTEQQRDRVEGYIAAGLREGARVVYGGGRPDALGRGWYVEPTIFADVKNDMTIAREEIFGPVMSVISYDTEDEAVAVANDSAYGLHGAVFTQDIDHGYRLAKRVRSGSIALNNFGLTPSTPFGGVKGSGVGREHGREGIEGFLEYKSYVVPAEFADRIEQRLGASEHG